MAWGKDNVENVFPLGRILSCGGDGAFVVQISSDGFPFPYSLIL